MKIIITVLFVLVSFLSYAQKYTPQNRYGDSIARAIFDKALFIPTGCGKPTKTNSVDSVRGALYYDSCFAKLWLYNPKLKVWDTIKGGGGSGVFSGKDSTAYRSSRQINDSTYSVKKLNGDSTIYLFQGGGSSGGSGGITDTTSLSNRINGKQKLITLTTTGSGASTFNQGSGALNIPTPPSTTPSYKVYTALLYQNPGSEFTAIVLENTFSVTPVWTRLGIGSNNLTFTGLNFSRNKVFISAPTLPIENSNFSKMEIKFNGSDNFAVFTYSSGASPAEGNDNENLVSFEIRVYN